MKVKVSLSTIEDLLRNEVKEAIHSAVTHKLNIGRLLNQAREKFPGDAEFGKWRAEFAREVFPGVAPRTLNSYMQLSKKYNGASDIVEYLGFSLSMELINAPQSTMNKVYNMIEDGEKPTVKQVRQMNKAENAPVEPVRVPIGLEPSKSAITPQPKPSKTRSLDELLEDVRKEKDFHIRRELLDEISCPTLLKAWAFFGLLAPNISESYGIEMVEYVKAHPALNDVDLHSYASDMRDEVLDVLEA
jgi:hypothetical protein